MRRLQVILQLSPIALAIIVYLIGGGLYISGATCICLLALQFLFLDEEQQATSQLHIIVDPRDPLVDIVAVQGLGSAYPHTWMGKKRNKSVGRQARFSFSKPKVERVMWLKEYLPEDFPTARIMAFEYNSKWLYNADFMGIDEHASALLDALIEQRQDSPSRPILFIGHSYGGLVVKQTLILSHNNSKISSHDHYRWIADVDSGVAFLGTPHQGSKYAMFALVLSFIYRPLGGNYTHVLKLLSDGDALTQLDNEFKPVLSRGTTKQTICFYETKGQVWSWPFGPLVTRLSARLGQGPEVAMECNHNDMNKFSERDERYRKFIGKLRPVYNTLANPVANEVVKDELRKKLSGRIISGSAYSSTEVEGCAAGTRETILKKLINWAHESTQEKVYWMTGMAGKGKSTIAYTLCERLENDGILGASFFCSTTEDETHNMLHVFPTLAYALSARSQRMADALLGALESKIIADMNLKNTFTTLIASPASTNGSPFRGQTRIVVLDGFDQVKDRNRVEAILSLIIKYSDAVSLKFFISSRPLSDKFENSPLLRSFDLDEHPEEEVREDIKFYVKNRLGELAERLGDKGEGWPTEEQVNAVVDHASPLFIYAATVCSYVGEVNNDQVKRRLQAVIDKVPVKGSTESPIDKLYALYAQITDAAFKKCNQDIDDVLGLIIVAKDYLSVSSIASLLFADDEAEGRSRVSAALDGLRSVLSVPKDHNEGVRVIHTSFPDFLTDPARSDEVYRQNPFECHRKLATSCLSLMGRTLDRDEIEGVQDPYASRDEVKKRANISGALEYSCVHWISHVIEVYDLKLESVKELEADVISFFEVQVLRWLVHMNVLGKLSHAVASLRKLELHSQISASVRRASMEVRRLTSMSYSFLESYPLQIYYSALMQLPKKSVIAKRFRKDWNWEVTCEITEDWERCEGVLKLEDRQVDSIVFSNDGRTVAACTGSEIRILGVEELKELSVLRPRGGLSCIALSSDGRSVAAGFRAGGIQVWDVETKNEKAQDIRKEWISCIIFVCEDQEVTYGSSKSICRRSIKSNERLADIRPVSKEMPQSFSSDGKKILLKGKDHIYILNAETGDKISTLELPGSQMRCAAFAGDGQKVASGLDDGTIRIFNVQSRIEEARLLGHMGAVTSIAFSGDNKRIVSSSFDGTVRIWSVLDRKEEMKLVGHMAVVMSVAYSNDSLRVASGSVDGTVRIWSVEPGLEERQSSVDQYRVTALALSGDEQRLFYASRDRRIRIRNVDSGQEERALLIGRDHVHTVAISNDGKHVATAARGKLLEIYNLAYSIYVPVVTMKGHEDFILSVIFSPDDQKVASGSHDRTIRICDRKTGKEEKKLEGHGNSVWSVVFSADGSKLVSGSSDNMIRIWDLEMETTVVTLRGHTGPVLSIAFSSDGQKVVSGSHDKTTRIWNVETGEVQQQETHKDSVWSVAFSSNNSKVVSGCSDTTIHVWDLEGGKVTILGGHIAAVLSVTFSSDQQQVVSGSHDTTVRLWDLKTGKEMRRMDGHTDSVQFVTFQGDESVLSASYDGTYRRWDVQTSKQQTEMVGLVNWVKSIDVSSDDRLLAVGMNDSTVRILDVETGDEEILQGHALTVRSVAFSYDNEKIISMSDDGKIHIWNVEKKEEEKRLDFGLHRLSSVTISPDLQTIALGDWNGTISFWNVETGRMEMKSINCFKSMSSMSFITNTDLVIRFCDMIGVWNVESGDERAPVPGSANVPILVRDGWIYSPSSSATNSRCWFPLKDIQRMVSTASCIAFGLESGDLVIVKFKQSI